MQSDPIGLAGGSNTHVYVNGNPTICVDPTGEIGLVGAAIGAGFELGAQALRNYYRGCDIFALGNYDWWDVGASAIAGGFAPGIVAAGKTAWRSGNAIRVLSSQSANTANRAAKLATRITSHKVAIRDITIIQGAYMAGKSTIKALNGSPSECECKR